MVKKKRKEKFSRNFNHLTFEINNEIKYIPIYFASRQMLNRMISS